MEKKDKIAELARNAPSIIDNKTKIMKNRYYLYVENIENNTTIKIVYTHPSLNKKRSVVVYNGDTLYGYSGNSDFNIAFRENDEEQIPDNLIQDTFNPIHIKAYPLHKSTIHKIMNNILKVGGNSNIMEEAFIDMILEYLEKISTMENDLEEQFTFNGLKQVISVLKERTDIELKTAIEVLLPYENLQNISKDVLVYLHDTLEEISSLYELEPMKYSPIVDSIRHLYEELLVKQYDIMSNLPSHYPDRDNPQFQKILEEKMEIQLLKQKLDKHNIITKIDSSCGNREFTYQNHQKITDVLLNPTTPYRSILLYHGTGVGKTCSSILSAESFLEKYPDRKINIILPPSVIGSFMKEVFSIDNYDKKRPQCTGDKYPIVANMIGEQKMTIIDKAVTNIIKNVYDFKGPIKFANDFIAMKTRYEKKYNKNPKLGLEKFRNWIIDTYENSFFIVDEVHMLRPTQKQKSIVDALEHILRVTKNITLMCMSATPIYNQPEELANLITLMRINEGRSPLLLSRMLNKETMTLEKKFIPYIIRKTAGYVSYMRSENPLYFAQQVYPSIYSPENMFKLKDMAKVSYKNEEIPKFRSFELIDTEYNENITESIQETLNLQGKTNMGTELAGRVLQMSNLLLPTLKDEKPELFHSNAINTHFNHRIIDKKRIEFSKVLNGKHKQFSYKQRSLEVYPEGIMNKVYLDRYAQKISKIMDYVLECCSSQQDGIIFIYSRFLDSGVIPICLALEELGFTKYGGVPLLKNTQSGIKRDYRGFTESEFDENKHGKFVQGTYTLLTGNPELTPFLQQDVRKTRLPSNIDGKHIKIIVGNEVVSEGVDFHNIRSLHILEPWYHFNLLIQVIGRAVRFCRHSDMNIKNRNVMVHLYGTRYNENSDYKDEETVDMYMYRIGEDKAKRIGELTRILKQNSVDCNLNRSINILKQEEINSQITNSVLMNGQTVNIPIGDKPYSYHCDFQEDCNYTCTNKHFGKTTNSNSFFPESYHYEIMSYIMKLKSIMKHHDTIMISELIEKEKMNPVILNEVLLRMNNNDKYIIFRENDKYKLEVLGNSMITIKPIKYNLGYHSFVSRTQKKHLISPYSVSHYNKFVISENIDSKQKENSIDIVNILNTPLNKEADSKLKSIPDLNNNIFNELFLDTLINITNRISQLELIDDTIIKKVRDDMLLELYMLTYENSKSYIENKIKEGIDTTSKLNKYILRNEKQEIIGYIMMDKNGIVIYTKDKDSDNYNKNIVERRKYIEKIKKEVRQMKPAKEFYTYRRMEAKSYNFKLMDIQEGVNRKGLNCHTTGQSNRYEIAYQRYDKLNENINLDLMELLKFKKQKGFYSMKLREEYSNRTRRFPGRIMCIVKEMLSRIQNEIQSDRTYFIGFPHNHIYTTNALIPLLKLEQ
jgi:hypothetical protein